MAAHPGLDVGRGNEEADGAAFLQREPWREGAPYFVCSEIGHGDFDSADGCGGPSGEAAKGFGKLAV